MICRLEVEPWVSAAMMCLGQVVDLETANEFHNEVFSIDSFSSYDVECDCIYESQVQEFERLHPECAPETLIAWRTWVETHNHTELCITSRPNFRFKATNYRVQWERHMGRRMTANRALTRQEMKRMLQTCLESMP